MSLDSLAAKAPSAPLDLGVLPSQLDDGIAARAAIGLVVLASDQTIEYEFSRLIRMPGVTFYAARIYNENDITPDTLRAMGPRLAKTVDLILPDRPLDVVAFGCTSASMLLSEKVVESEIHKVRPGVACTNPVTGMLAGFRALGVKNIGLLTPYAPEINASMAAYFNRSGLNVAAVATFDRRDDRDVPLISLDSIEAGIERLAAAPGVDGVFVSCTSLRLAEAVAGIEKRIGLPVTSSNHAMIWHCLRLAGVDDKIPELGRLFELQLA